MITVHNNSTEPTNCPDPDSSEGSQPHYASSNNNAETADDEMHGEGGNEASKKKEIRIRPGVVPRTKKEPAAMKKKKESKTEHDKVKNNY